MLAAQVVNFLVLLFILKKLLYKPLLKVLKERRETIAQSLKNAEEIEKKLLKTEEDREKVIEKAAKEAKKIVEEATRSGEVIIEDARKTASKDMEDILEKGRQEIVMERERMQSEMRVQFAQVVETGLKKVIEGMFDPKKQKEMIEKTVGKL